MSQVEKLKLEKDKYSLKWGEKYSTLVVDVAARSIISHSNIIGNDIRDYLSFVKNRNIVKVYYGEKNINKLERLHGNYFLKKNRILKTINYYDRIIEEYKQLFEEYNNYNYKSLSSKKLHLLFKKYISFTEKSMAFFRMTREEGEREPTKKIKIILKKYFPEHKIEEVFQIITQSAGIDMVGEERMAWRKILKNNWDEAKVSKYVMNFPANFVNMYEMASIMQYLKKRYSEDKKHLKEIEKEIQRSREQKIRLRSKQRAIYKKCNYEDDLVVYSQMIQKFGPYRFRLKYCWAGAELHLLKFFEEICSRMNVSLVDFFDLYLVEDINNYFKTGLTLSKKQLKEREKCILIHVKKKKYHLYFGTSALQIVDKIENKEVKEKEELKGRVAFRGYVKGRVKVVYSTDMEKMTKTAKRFSAGDILVSENTQPAMIVLMKKSAAILTEQGGLTSHASIVSREFKKPCIVGIKGLIKTLKDGDLVEVDAIKGIVKVIKKASK